MSNRQLVAEQSEPMRPTGVMPGQDREPEEMDPEAVDPAEQQVYDQLMVKAMETIHGQKSSPAVLAHMNQKDLTVPEAVGRTASWLLGAISGSAKAAKQPIPPDVAFHAAAEIVQELYEFGAAAKIFPKEALNPETVEQAWLHTIDDRYAEELQTPEGKAAMREAQDLFAQGIAVETDAGALDPQFGAGPERELVAAGGAA
jgi:hypothetical protein